MSNNDRGRVGGSPKRKRVLALIASISMLTLGMVGVVFAPAASAHHTTVSGVVGPCVQDDEVWGKTITWSVVNSEADKTMTLTSNPAGVATGSIGAGGTGTYYQFVTTPGNYYLTIYGTWSNGNTNTNTNANAVTVSFEGCPPPSGYVDGGSFEYCADDTNGFVSWDGASWGPEGDFETEQEAQDAVDQRETEAMSSVPEDAEEGRCAPSLDSSLTCAAWSVEIRNYVGEVTPSIAVPQITVVVKIDGNIVDEGVLDGGNFIESGTHDLADGPHTLTVEINGQVVDELTREVTCSTPPPPPPPGCTSNCGGTPPPPAPQVTPPVVAAVVVPVAPAVAPVAPAVVPVAKPKPAKVNAPASVPAGVAKLPVAATVPSSVPAGNGPVTPSLPVWALTLIAVGALGAAGAGMRILGDRK